MDVPTAWSYFKFGVWLGKALGLAAASHAGDGEGCPSHPSTQVAFSGVGTSEEHGHPGADSGKGLSEGRTRWVH